MNSAPNINYQKLFDKFKEIDKLEVKDWTKNHILGYFVKKYKEQYNIDYSFKFNNPAPSKCFEVWQISALSSKLSSNPQTLKDYIDWVFLTVVPKTKRRFTSISFINKDETVSYYKMNVLWAEHTNKKIDRETILPAQYNDVLKAFPHIKTYGDLAFISQIEPMPDDMVKLFNDMENLGFNKNILDNIV